MPQYMHLKLGEDMKTYSKLIWSLSQADNANACYCWAGLIVEYLIGKYGPQLAPPKTDEAKTLQYKYWLHFSEGMDAFVLHHMLFTWRQSLKSDKAMLQCTPKFDFNNHNDLNIYNRCCPLDQCVLSFRLPCFLVPVPSSQRGYLVWEMSAKTLDLSTAKCCLSISFSVLLGTRQSEKQSAIYFRHFFFLKTYRNFQLSTL